MWSQLFIVEVHVHNHNTNYSPYSPPIIRFHNKMSLGLMVTRLPWIAHRLTFSNIVTRNASEASCRARMAVLWKRSVLSIFWATSLTKRWKGSFLIKSSVNFWYFRIWRTSLGSKYNGAFETVNVCFENQMWCFKSPIIFWYLVMMGGTSGQCFWN